ncbi:coiled-coil domain-containing protein 170 isoform X4 [Leptinotarsa decemlineata]|uniref:coiled-coil domain-containing protein 170 isoform X4 n=1 Tax=Leptinotarsa decemlineata TaxID=7539 RepID=UPI003D305680
MQAPPPAESVGSGNTEEDWHVFEVLCKDMNMEEAEVDVATSLRSEIAALQYKRDRLQTDLEEMRSQVRTRDQRCLDLQVEADQLREQSARQNAIISSLKKRVHELEERERNLIAAQGRHEIALQTAHRDVRYNEEKVKELESKVRNLELDLSSEEQKKDSARLQLQDFVRRLSIALGADLLDYSHISPESLVHKASELVQETSRLRNKAGSIHDTLSTVEVDLRTCKENLERALADRECLQRQSAAQLLEIDRLRQEKENADMQNRVTERELNELKDKLALSNRSLGNASGNIAQQESMICQMRDDIKMKEERILRLQADNKHTLESLAIILSTPSRFVESLEATIKDRIHEIINDNKDKTAQLEALRDKLGQESQQLSRQISLYEQATARLRALEDEKNHLEARLHKADAEISACELSRDGLKRDKSTFMNFLDRLARALNMDEISHDIGVDLHTESLLLRAEQLARLESEKLVDKITALERGRKIEDLQKRLIESESLRTKYNRKVTLLKDQVRATGETIEQERNISDHSMQLIRDELARVKDSLSEVQRRESQLQTFKHSIAKILGVALPMPDYELVSRLQKLVDAHHDFTLVSRRYDDPVLRLTSRSPTGGSRCTRTPDRSRYDDSGYTDAVDLDDIDDDLFKRQTRPM